MNKKRKKNVFTSMLLCEHRNQRTFPIYTLASRYRGLPRFVIGVYTSQLRTPPNNND